MMKVYAIKRKSTGCYLCSYDKNQFYMRWRYGNILPVFKRNIMCAFFATQKSKAEEYYNELIDSCSEYLELKKYIKELESIEFFNEPSNKKLSASHKTILNKFPVKRYDFANSQLIADVKYDLDMIVRNCDMIEKLVLPKLTSSSIVETDYIVKKSPRDYTWDINAMWRQEEDDEVNNGNVSYCSVCGYAIPMIPHFVSGGVHICAICMKKHMDIIDKKFESIPKDIIKVYEEQRFLDGLG